MRRVSRLQFLQGGAVAAGAVAGAGFVDVASALGAGDRADPRPIPGGFDENFNLVPHDPLVHVLAPFVGVEMSTITDFNGLIAAGEAQGTANHGAFNFDVDMRVMQGSYVSVDNRLRQGSFGFI
jgi:hypothetical protein